MSRRTRYRELQGSVPGLEGLYQNLATKIALPEYADSRVLIVGGGGGREIELFAKLGATIPLTVIDPSADNLADAETVARETAYRGEIHFVEGTVDCLPETARFGTAMIIFVLHAIYQDEEEQRLLSSLRSRLADNGRLLLADICFDSSSTIEEMVAAYKEHARLKNTARDLVDLEIRSVMECRDRTELSLYKKLNAARFHNASLFDRALWYAAFTIEPA